MPLPDYIGPDCRVLFVGLNPGLRSEAVGHHFAGRTNRFWRLMAEAGFVPAGVTYLADRELPRYGWGITNLVARPTRGVSDLGSDDYARGRDDLRAKILRRRPRLVAMLGLTVFREVFRYRGTVACGLNPETIDGIPLFVLPNPSGRNAHFTYREMLASFVELRCLVDRIGVGSSGA